MDDAIVDTRVAIDDGLFEYLTDRLRISGEAGLQAADLSEGLLISVLRLISPDGKYPLDKGRFWQLLDRHYPLDPEETIRSRLAIEIEALSLRRHTRSSKTASTATCRWN